MPTISVFRGMVVTMYSNDHPPKHFHVDYQGGKAEIDFDGNIIVGALPSKQLRIIKAWAVLHKDELEKNWNLARSGKALNKIKPIR